METSPISTCRNGACPLLGFSDITSSFPLSLAFHHCIVCSFHTNSALTGIYQVVYISVRSTLSELIGRRGRV